MWLPSHAINAVDQVAHITYVSRRQTELWNKHRRDGELRLLTGWAWTARNGRSYRQGFKTMTVAYRDAYYSLIQHSAAPMNLRPRLKVAA